MAKGMKPIDWVAFVLLMIGGINWGLVGAFSFDLVQFLLGTIPILAKIVYIAVGLSGVYALMFLIKKLKG